MTGRSGNDTLSGGAVADQLHGGAGAGSFLFDTAPTSASFDRIVGYVVNDDTIFLDHAIFGLPVGAWQRQTTPPTLTGVPALPSDRIIFETDTSKIWFDPDGVGGVAGVVVALVAGTLTGFGPGEFLVF